MARATNVPQNHKNICAEIVELLEAPYSAFARNVNSIMTEVYWEIGRRIVHFDQAGRKRAEDGDALIKRLDFTNASRSQRIKPPCSQKRGET